MPRGGSRPGAGRKKTRHKGPKAGSYKAILAGAKRTKVALIKQHAPTAKQMKAVAKQTMALRQTKKKAIKKRAKVSIKQPTAISPRHKANLIQPSKPFKYTRHSSVGLRSTAIAKYDYDTTTLTLGITFTKVKITKGVIRIIGQGGSYLWFMVPKEIYWGLERASSKGRYYNRFIKNKFDHKPI